MAELLRTRCSQGKVIITDTHIIVELGSIKSQTMARSSFTALDSKLAMWLPGMSRHKLIIHGQGGERLNVGMVKAKDAKRIRAILTGRE